MKLLKLIFGLILLSGCIGQADYFTKFDEIQASYGLNETSLLPGTKSELVDLKSDLLSLKLVSKDNSRRSKALEALVDVKLELINMQLSYLDGQSYMRGVGFTSDCSQNSLLTKAKNEFQKAADKANLVLQKKRFLQKQYKDELKDGNVYFGNNFDSLIQSRLDANKDLVKNLELRCT